MSIISYFFLFLQDMISSSSSGVKCLKNLDIVMESADEGQALLLINTIAPACNGSSSSSSGQEREHQLQQGDDIAHAIARPTMKTKMKLANAISDDDNDEGKVTTTATLKGRKKGSNHQQQQPSRVERSRLSVITFLNNITAPPTRTDGGKSWRSLSVSSSSVQQHHHNHQQHLPMPSATTTTEQGSQMELEKQKMNTETDNGTTEKDGTASTASGHRLTKSLCGTKTADEAHHHLHIDSIDGRRSGGVEQHEHGASSGGSAEKSAANSTGNGGGTISIGMANCVVGGSGNVMLADRLSIKSGASSTSSSGAHSESQCNLSVGKQMKARECPVCYIRQQPNNFHKLQTCSHLTCKTCLVKYLNLEIMESRTNISCPNCTALLHASDIYALLDHQPDLLERYELFALRRALSTDPDARWCPAPDCTYAVIAYSCAACPQLKCERCETMFCYHCKNNWHPNQTCDQARSKLTGGLRAFAAQATAIMTDSMSTGGDVTKACPRCGVQIMKMNDGSCNHMQCVLCNAEFCWLCLKQINELHYLSPTGCTFWGKKPWTRKKKLLWQVGTLIGAPLGIALIAGLAVPGIICGVPIFVGRKIYQRFANLSKTRRRLITALGVFGSLLVSPVLAVLTVGVGVPIMLAYVYGVVPLSLCRNGGCGGGGSSSSNNDELLNGMSDFDVAYGEAEIDGPTSPTAMDEEGPGTSQNGKMMGTSAGTKYDTSNNGQPNNQQQREEEKTSNKSSFHHRRQSIASSGLVSLTDKVNTEDASIQAIAGSQYNFDSRSVHTVWSSGQYGVQLGAVELAQEANSYNNEDAENSSTLACCSASIVAQASERRSLTGSNGSIRNIRPRSSISNSRANSEEKSKFLRKVSHNCKDQQQHQSSTTIGGVSGGTDGGREDIQKQQQQHVRRSSSQSGNNSNHHHPSAVVVSSSSSIAFSRRQQGVVAGNSTSSVGVTAVHAVRTRPRLTFRSFLRHPVNSIFGSKSARVKS